jgi:hypothetical protein
MVPRRTAINKMNLIIKMESLTILTTRMRVVTIMVRTKKTISKTWTLLPTKKMMMQLCTRNWLPLNLRGKEQRMTFNF